MIFFQISLASATWCKKRSISPMHPFFRKASGLTETIIAAAIEVHRRIGPGLIESIYEWCLLKELELRGLLWVLGIELHRFFRVQVEVHEQPDILGPIGIDDRAIDRDVAHLGRP